MKAIRTTLLTFLSSVSLVLPVWSADPQFQRVSNTNGFSLDILVTWKEIDPGVLDALMDPFEESSSPMRFRMKRIGYGPSVEAVTNSPYVGVEVRKGRRFPERVVKLQERPDFVRNAVVHQLAKDGILERNISNVSYDTNRHAISFSFTKVDPFVKSELRVSNLITFTEEGSMAFVAVCPVELWSTSSQLVQQVMSSFKVSKHLQYSSRKVEVQVGSMWKEISMVLGAMVLAGLAWIAYQRHANSVMSDEL